ncbi:hypothetical protein [Curtobacterium sp. DN_7.5]|uniref:hypothetical protein n=1 Tax=Curtobacterium sp. DN_7.5 TaxID=3049047 RepID=UPI001F58D1AE|nr:hypothetical protein [Curtobacterium sp. DN_7.5]
MSKHRTAITSLVLVTTVIASALVTAPAATAATTMPRAGTAEQTHGAEVEISPEQLAAALGEARADGLVVANSERADGSTVTRIDLGDGFTFDLVTERSRERIGAGTDSKGTYVSFNATDQNMIISGAAFALGAAVCAVSGGTFCVVVGAILTAATVAITGSGAIRCGTKQLRVYPFAGGKVKPWCA